MRPMTTLWLVVGPSATGKSTLVSGLCTHVPGLSEAVSTTTRSPREGEVDGIHYHFVDKDSFRDLVEAGALVEWVHYNGHFYGITRREIAEKLSRGDVLLVVEGEGAQQILKAYPEAQVLFLEPPSTEELAQRMRLRGDKPEGIQQRLASIERELSYRHLATYLLPPETPLKLLRLAAKLVAGRRLRAA